MAISVITGSDGIGKYLEAADQNVINIVMGVESMNSPQALPRLRGMDFLNTFVRNVEGVQGHTEGFKEYKVFASDDGSFTDAVSYKETYETWSFSRRGYTVKDRDFTHEMLDLAYEENKDLSKIVSDRMMAISKMYLNEYLPNIAYEALFTVPSYSNTRTYYGIPEGFLRGENVDPEMLKVYAQGQTERNHYRAIENVTVGGVDSADIEDIVELLSEYRDITDGNIVAIANRIALYKLVNTLQYMASKDVFNRTGQPSETIAGVMFIVNDFMPRNWILFLAGEAPHLITKLISPKADRRGMAIVRENGFQKLENVYDLVGSQFKILPEGYHLTGRHYGCFLNIDASVNSANLSPAEAGRYTRPLKNLALDQTVISELSQHAFQLRSMWYRGLR